MPEPEHTDQSGDDTPMAQTQSPATNSPSRPCGKHFVPTKVPNLFRLEPLGTYYARAMVQGKPLRESLRTKNYKIAVDKLRKWMVDRAAGTHRNVGIMGGLIEDYLRELDSNADIRNSTKAVKRENLEQIRKVYHFIANSAKLDEVDFRHGGKRTTGTVQHRYREWDGVVISKLTNSNIRVLRSSLAEVYASSRVNSCLTVLSELLDLAVEKGLLSKHHELDKDLKYVKNEQSQSLRLPSSAQINALGVEIRRRCANPGPFQGNAEGGLFFDFLRLSGARVGSARALRWEDVDEVHNTLFFRKTKRETYHIPLSRPLHELLSAIREHQKTHPLPEVSRGKVFHIKSIAKVMTSACRALNISHLHHHDLRHLFATRCIELGVDIPTVAKWLGHKDGGLLAMKVYGHLRDEHSQHQAAKIDKM